MSKFSHSQKVFIKALSGLSLLCLLLFLLRIIAADTFRYGFIPWNLVLAWLALGLGWLASRRINQPIGFETVLIIVLWLGFLPNSWYVLTDFVHVYATGEISQLYDIVLIASLSIVGFIAGFTSLLLVHNQLIKRLGERTANYLAAGVLLLSSFGIYLGRDLRWNTWDVIRDPAGIIVDLTDRIIDPLGHPRFITITCLFFVLLGTLYFGIWQFYKSLGSGRSGQKKPKD